MTNITGIDVVPCGGAEPEVKALAISVVMSVYNGERFVRQAVESILTQSFRDFEFIAIDDGSTDASPCILEEYARRDARLRLVRQGNSGLSDSLNRGCGLARGKYIARMDADDVAMPRRLWTQYEFMEGHPQVAVVGGAVECVDSEGRTFRTVRFPYRNKEIYSALLDDCVLCHPTVMIRKDAFESVGGYRSGMRDAEDYDLWLRISERHELANLRETVLKYRIHPHQISVKKADQEGLSGLAARISATNRRSGKADPLARMTGVVTPEVLSQIGVSEATQTAAIARQYLRCVRNMYNARNYSVALNILDSEHLNAKNVEKWVVAEGHFFAAKLEFRRGRIGAAVRELFQAVRTRPTIAGRPIKKAICWISDRGERLTR